MKKKPLISVIIPIYNVEAYLERCVYSVLHQEYTNLEIILINDGSTDNCGEICNNLQKKDDRIIIINKKNGGLSDARNAALDIAKGDWITFVDSDDWVAPDYVSGLYDLANSTNAQISIGSFRATKKDEVLSKNNVKENIKVFSSYEALHSLLYQKLFTTSVWGKLFKAELFENIRFPVGKLYEDVEIIYLLLKKIDIVAYTNRTYYYYFQRENSIVGTKFSIRKMDYIYHTKNILNDVKKEYPQLTNAAISRMLWAEIHVMLQMEQKEEYKKEYSEIWKDIKQYRKLVLFDADVTIKNKLVIVLTYLGRNIMRLFYIICKSR